MRLKYKNIEVEGKDQDEIKWLLDKVKELGADFNDDTETENVIVHRSTGIPVKIPADGERLRRTKEEIKIDEDRANEGLPPMTREEIITRRKGMLNGGGNSKFEIDFDDVPL